MKYKTHRPRYTTVIVFLMAALLLTTSGCNELNQLADLQEIEDLLAQMQRDSLYDPPLIRSIQELAPTTDSVITESVTFDSLPQNTLLTTFKKVKLDGHDYWTITTVGGNMGGAGITHSESCWCRRVRPFNHLEMTRPSVQNKREKLQKAK